MATPAWAKIESFLTHEINQFWVVRDFLLFGSFIVFPQSTGSGTKKNAFGLWGKNMFDYNPLPRPSVSSTSHKYLPVLRLLSQVDCRHRKGHRNFESTSIYAFPCEIKSPVLHTEGSIVRIITLTASPQLLYS